MWTTIDAFLQGKQWKSDIFGTLWFHLSGKHFKLLAEGAWSKQSGISTNFISWAWKWTGKKLAQNIFAYISVCYKKDVSTTLNHIFQIIVHYNGLPESQSKYRINTECLSGKTTQIKHLHSRTTTKFTTNRFTTNKFPTKKGFSIERKHIKNMRSMFTSIIQFSNFALPHFD